MYSLQETRTQLRALDTETDKLRHSLSSSKQLQKEQSKLISDLKETVESYHNKVMESDARLELMQVEMHGLTELSNALNGQVRHHAFFSSLIVLSLFFSLSLSSFSL